MEMIDRPYASSFEKYASQDKNILCLSADLTSSCEVDKFRDAYPNQFISFGLAEQHMLSFAAGLEMEGYRPFLHTFGVFLYRRPLDQLICSIAYPNRKIRLMGFLPGIVTPGGATHQAIDDIGVLRVIPNMTILEAGDATEVENIVSIADQIEGPVYARIWRGSVPRLFASSMQFNKLRLISEGRKVLVLSSGICTEEALRATQALRDAGISICHAHVSTYKPFDTDTFDRLLAEVECGVVVLENHSIIGGLGSIVAEHMAEKASGKALIRLGLKDTFAHGASKPYLMRKYGLDAMALVDAVEKLLNKKLGITPDALSAIRIDKVHSNAKAEAL